MCKFGRYRRGRCVVHRVSGRRAALTLLGVSLIASPAGAELYRHELCWREGPPSTLGRQAPYMCEMHLAYLDGDMRRWRAWLRRGARAGIPHFQVQLGVELRVGKRMPRDYAEAGKWMRRAARNGDPLAQSLMGTWYYAGTVFARNFTLARLWMRRAADNGNWSATFAVAAYYRHGIGGAVDKPLAAYYLERALARFRKSAKGQLGDGERLFRIAVWHLCTFDAPQDTKMARRFLTEAAAVGHADARYLLGQNLTAIANEAQCRKWPSLWSHPRRSRKPNPAP